MKVENEIKNIIDFIGGNTPEKKEVVKKEDEEEKTKSSKKFMTRKSLAVSTIEEDN
jgi:hypothetical protein